jgi:hypothetical protein
MDETVVIKGVDGNVYRNFKGEAMKMGLKMGQAATEAFRLWVHHTTSSRLGELERRKSLSESMDAKRALLTSEDGWDSTELIRSWRDARRR